VVNTYAKQVFTNKSSAKGIKGGKDNNYSRKTHESGKESSGRFWPTLLLLGQGLETPRLG